MTIKTNNIEEVIAVLTGEYTYEAAEFKNFVFRRSDVPADLTADEAREHVVKYSGRRR